MQLGFQVHLGSPDTLCHIVGSHQFDQSCGRHTTNGFVCVHLCIVSPVARVGSVMRVGVGTLGSLGWPRVIHSDGPASGNFGMVPNVGVGVEVGV